MYLISYGYSSPTKNVSAFFIAGFVVNYVDSWSQVILLVIPVTIDLT